MQSAEWERSRRRPPGNGDVPERGDLIRDQRKNALECPCRRYCPARVIGENTPPWRDAAA